MRSTCKASMKMTERPRFQSDVLGELRWDTEAEGWVADYAEGERRIRVVVDGGDRPDAAALSRAEDAFSKWPEYQNRITGFLELQAESYRRSGLRDEVLALQVDEVVFPIAHRHDAYVAVWFQGPTDERQWHMEFDDRKLRHFAFQWG
jgi:hypothetical protein